LLDAMRRDCVQDPRTEEPVQSLQNFAVALALRLCRSA
jgi:hypothetical protein